ncbi:hypothetical protein ACFX11_006019 [Malus domestica]
MTSEEATRLGLRVTKEPGSVKTVNSAATPIVGGKIDFTVVKMDDYGVVIGLEFMDKASQEVYPALVGNSICQVLEEMRGHISCNPNVE